MTSVFFLASSSLNAGNAGVNLRPGYILPTHGFYNGWNALNKPLRTTFSADLQYTFSLSGSSVYQGAGVGLHSFFSGELLGTPVSLHILQGVPLVHLCNGLRLGYEWNFGLSAGWKDNGVVTVSPFNAYINVALLFDWKIGRYWSITFGPEYTHFSNGDTMFPNAGANTLNFRVGTRCNLAGSRDDGVVKIFERNPARGLFKDNISFDLTASGGWRADRFLDQDGNLVIDNRAYALIGLQFNPLYHFNDYLSVGPSLDFVYDASANRNFRRDFVSQSAIGLSARGELSMPIFSVNVGGGYNVLQSGSDLKGFYGIFSLKAFLTEKFYLNVTYRLGQTNYAHNMMFGLGWRFRKPH